MQSVQIVPDVKGQPPSPARPFLILDNPRPQATRPLTYEAL